MLKLSIIIPTKNRFQNIKKILFFIISKKFFFNEIIIIDSSDNEDKNKVYKICSAYKKKYKIKILLFYSRPSTSEQRNLGIFKSNKKNKYIMFLDDDIKFYKNSLENAKKFILQTDKSVGAIGFNLIEKVKNNFLSKIKNSKLSEILGLYSQKKGFVAKSGWHTKAVNLKKNTYVNWLSTQAVIYKKEKIKNIRFDKNLGSYSYLEDLDFSYEVSKKSKLVICHNAKYSHLFTKSNRDEFDFGRKEIFNRYYFLKKHNLYKVNFYFACLLKISTNLLLTLTKNKLSLKRFFGNISGIFKIIRY